MSYSKVISLGATCTPTWQIRKFTGDEKLYPFDWILTPFKSLLNIIQNDFKDFASSNSFFLTEDGRSIYNSRYHVLHHHDFAVDQNGYILPEKWKEKAQAMPRLYELLIEVWHNTLSSSQSILFVRHQGHFDINSWKCVSDLSSQEMTELCVLLESKYPKLSFDVLFVTAGHERPTHPRVKLAQVGWGQQDWENTSDQWKGATQDWQRELENANQRNPTAFLS